MAETAEGLRRQGLFSVHARSDSTRSERAFGALRRRWTANGNDHGGKVSFELRPRLIPIEINIFSYMTRTPGIESVSVPQPLSI
jgi:hypothetical protein